MIAKASDQQAKKPISKLRFNLHNPLNFFISFMVISFIIAFIIGGFVLGKM